MSQKANIYIKIIILPDIKVVIMEITSMNGKKLSETIN